MRCIFLGATSFSSRVNSSTFSFPNLEIQFQSTKQKLLDNATPMEYIRLSVVVEDPIWLQSKTVLQIESLVLIYIFSDKAQ